MKLRGLLYRKIKARKKDPAFESAYKAAYQAELEKRIRANIEQHEATTVAKAKARAQRDAIRATTSRSERLVTAGGKLGKFVKQKMENMPDADEYARRMQKVSLAVTGTAPKKKRTVTRG